MDKIKLPGHGTLVDDNGNTLGRVTDLVIEGVTPAAAHDHLADAFPEEVVEVSLYDQATELLVQAERDRQARLLAMRDRQARLLAMRNSNGVFGKMGGSVEGTLYDPKVAQRITEEGNRQLRNYISRDIEFTEKAAKDLAVEMVIAEALAMERRGRPAPLPRPTYLAVAIRAIYDDIESWSRP